MTEGAPRSPRELVVVGAGKYGAVIAELAESCGYQVIGYLDDDERLQGTHPLGRPVLAPVSEGLGRLSHDISVAVAIGNNSVRLDLLKKARSLGFSIPALVSPQAVVSPSVRIEEAVYLHPASQVWTETELHFGTIVSFGASVMHHCVLEEGSIVTGGATVGASVHVGTSSFFGVGSSVATGVVRIAPHTLVGAGAVVIRNTEEYGVYVGNPARLLKYQAITPSSEALSPPFPTLERA